jgi:hypothetical protein
MKINFKSYDKKKLQEDFKKYKCIFLPELLEKHTLGRLIEKIEKINFESKLENDEQGKFGKIKFIPQNEAVIFLFNMIFNETVFFEFIQKITENKKIDNFKGRIHRSVGLQNHEIDWHGDNSDNRLLAMTISLGKDTYTGGFLQIREKVSKKKLSEFGQLNAGDAVIFQISPDLEHRLTKVETGSRTVGVGWFRWA